MSNGCSAENFLDCKYASCCMCNGFYGLNYEQPLCSTCHLFLYPLDINWPDDVAFLEKADSGDSGNEEPIVETDFYSKIDDNVGVAAVFVQSVSQLVHPKPDRLAERITNLSHPRDYDLENIPSGLIESLPTEVLVTLFRYLDDVSLCRALNVCTRWRNIINAELSEKQWQTFLCRRWPLFEPQYRPRSWKTLYAQLLESCCCITCLENMLVHNGAPVSENSWRYKRLRSELKALRSDPLEGIQAKPIDRHLSHWQASIAGPRGSPYEGGIFFLCLQIPHSYPMHPPVVRFITRVFHPNVSRHGDVGLDSIHHNWSLALTVSKVLLSIQSLLTDPYCEVCMEPSIGKLYLTDLPEFNRIACLWTWKCDARLLNACCFGQNSVH